MKVLMTTGVFPPDIGGPATYVSQIARALAARGHAVTVVTLSERMDAHEAPLPVQVVRLARRTFKPWRWIRTVGKLWQLGRQADVLFVNGLAMEAALANFLLRKPMVQKVVGDLAWEQAVNRGWVSDVFEVFQTRRYGFKVALLKALRTWWTRRAGLVIVPSRYLARWVARWGVPEERLAVIYNALEPLERVEPSEVPLPTPLKIATVGRLVVWKRIDQVIAAVAACREAGLLIVGDGPERARLEALSHSLGVADRVHFAGPRSREETLRLLAACDGFVLNSTYEGCPHTLLEAMGLGLPVVATAAGGTPEVVQHGLNGWLVEPSDDTALREALARFVPSRAAGRLFPHQASEIMRRFDFPTMVGHTERLLRDAVGRRPAREGVRSGPGAPEAITPIFVVGAPHSGTTLLYRLLAMHPDVAWFSQFSQRDGTIPGRMRLPGSAVLNRLLRSCRAHDWHKQTSRARSALVPTPKERTTIWASVVSPAGAVSSHAVLTGMRQVFSRECRAWHRSVLLVKFLKLSRHLPLLRAAYPNAKFVHIVRDGRAVALSRRRKLLKREGSASSALQEAARTWVDYVSRLHHQKQPGDLLEIRYEDFCAAPREHLARILRFLELPLHRFPLRKCPQQLAVTNAKWRERATDSEVALLDAMLSEWLTVYGYQTPWIESPVAHHAASV